MIISFSIAFSASQSCSASYLICDLYLLLFTVKPFGAAFVNPFNQLIVFPSLFFGEMLQLTDYPGILVYQIIQMSIAGLVCHHPISFAPEIVAAQHRPVNKNLYKKIAANSF